MELIRSFHGRGQHLIQIFQSSKERLTLGIQGTYPEHLTEIVKDKSEVRHSVNEMQTRPWIRHYFLTQALRDNQHGDDIVARDANLIAIFKTTIPLSENSFGESGLHAWRMFLDNAYRESDASWYGGIRKVLVRDRYFAAIEQLELEIPISNPQRVLQFTDHMRVLRRYPRVPVKLFFAIPGNEKETIVSILRQSVRENPTNMDLALLAFAFFKAWNREMEFLDLAQQTERKDLEEWYHWVEGNLAKLGELKRAAGDHTSVFHIFERAQMSPAELKELGDWFLKENEFKCAYHYYYRAKEYETALDLLQNISIKEFADLTNLRRVAAGQKPYDFHADATKINSLYQEETETLRGFARIRAAESYKQVVRNARQQFDRETIEMKYAFGELSEDEYQRLIRQISERKQ